MINKKFLEEMEASLQCSSILVDEPMKKHTTFRVGGNADAFISVGSINDIKTILRLAHDEKVPYYVCGNGSNLLVSDNGFRGVIVHVGDQLNKITIDGNVISAQAGAFLSKVSKEAAAEGLTGLEFAQGIPGTLGGAIVMNAGAYDGEMKNVVKSVTVIDKMGELRKLSLDELEFGYRESSLKHNSWICLEVVMELQAGNMQEIKDKMADFAFRRKDKQPLEYPSAGSTFKRPEGHFAGKLIMDAGLSGFEIGGAAVSTKHCGFVINKGEATAQNVFDVIREVQRQVQIKFDVTLQPEVIFLGEFK